MPIVEDTRPLLIKCVAGLVALDLIGAVAVRLLIGDVPVVMGDVAKVGIGGLVMAGGLRTRSK